MWGTWMWEAGCERVSRWLRSQCQLHEANAVSKMGFVHCCFCTHKFRHPKLGLIPHQGRGRSSPKTTALVRGQAGGSDPHLLCSGGHRPNLAELALLNTQGVGAFPGKLGPNVPRVHCHLVQSVLPPPASGQLSSSISRAQAIPRIL